MADEATTGTPGAASADDASLASALGSDTFEREGSEPQFSADDGTSAKAPAPETETASAEQPESADGADSGDSVSISDLNQLAEHLGIPYDELVSGINVKLKIDGEDKDTTLADVLKINQLEGHVNRKSIELSDKQKAWEGEVAQARQQWQQRMSLADQFLGTQEARLNQQFQQVNWQQLAAQDPALYSSTYLQFQQAAQQLQAQKAGLQQAYAQSTQQMVESARTQAAPVIRAQNPDLADPVAYSNAVGEIHSYLKGIGAAESNFGAVEQDPVVFRVARDAARYAQIAASRATTAKKVAAAPKFEKASPRVGGNDRTRALRDRANRGDEDAMASLLGAGLR